MSYRNVIGLEGDRNGAAMEHEVREKLKKLGADILQASRNELYLNMRFLDVALSSLEYEMSLKTFLIGTEGDYLYYNPRFLAERYQQDRVLVNRAYLHLLLHCLFRHPFTREERETDVWNLACDIAVESILDTFTYKATARLVSDLREQCYEALHQELKVLTAEGVYQVLQQRELSPREFDHLCLEFLVDDHGFWESEKKDQSKENSDSGKEQQEQQRQQRNQKWKHHSEKMKTNLETFSKQMGDEAGGLLKAVQVVCRERCDYRQFLRKFAVPREEMRIDDDAFDYIYYCYGLEHYGNMPLMEALEYKETMGIEEFVIVIDTSGSCSGRLVEAFIRETGSILMDTETFFKKVRIHLIQCDSMVQEDVRITSLEELHTYIEHMEVKGHGGTDFRPAFAYVDQLIEAGELAHLKGLLYFTDGIGVYPAKRPRYDTAFVFMKDDYSDAAVPVWAIKLLLEPDDIMKEELHP